MLTIELYFLAGRFHATPWDRHVNEGVVEWPISSWRFMRALMAVGYRKLGWNAENPPDEMHLLVNALSESLPKYWLPPASLGHTRHYMPKYRSMLDGKTDKVIDAFVIVDPKEPMIVHWPNVELNDESSKLLGNLLGNLTYLGRAESWVEAVITNELRTNPNAVPVGENDAAIEVENVALLAPMRPSEYNDWRNEWLDSERNRLLDAKRLRAIEKGKDPDKVKLATKEDSSLEARLGRSLFSSMLVGTGTLRAEGWNRPPGSRWADYKRPSNCFSVNPTVRKVRSVDAPVVARFNLSSETTQADVRPRFEDALFLSDNLRKALMSLSGQRNNGVPSKTFSGKSEDGHPLKGHRHAFFLPVDEDNDGRIDSVIVYAPNGFSYLDQIAMGSLRRLWQHGGRPGLLPILVGMGALEDFGGMDTLKGLSPLLTKAHVWESRTPFVLTRFPKVRRNGEPKRRQDGTWIDGPEDQLRVEIKRRGFPELEKIEELSHTRSRGRKIFWRDFARFRSNGGGARAGGGYGFRMVFQKPVRGPIALGYGCHFGLGQFSAVS